MHLEPEPVRGQQAALKKERLRLWHGRSISERGYAGFRVESTRAWRQSFDAMDWGNGYMG
jgi:hypothetical protein